MPERLDTESMPLTEPHWPPTFDTGPHPRPLSTGEPEQPPDPDPMDSPWRMESVTEHISWADEDRASQADLAAREPQHVPAPSAVLRGQYQYLKRWKFVLLLLGVWIVAAAAGAGLYYWWFHTVDKTWPDFAVLMYVLACTVAATLVSLVEHRPTVAGIAIAMMSAPFASGLAAAALYGMYVFGWVTP